MFSLTHCLEILPQLFNREKKAPPLDESTIDPDVVDEAKHAMHADETTPEIALVARGLTKYYKDHLAVDQISFSK